MKSKKTFKPHLIAGIVGATMLAACGGKYAASQFSIPEAKVYKTEGLGNSQYSCVDFKDFGSEDDATLGITPDEQGGFDIYLGVKFRHTTTEVVRDEKGQIFRTFSDGKIWARDLKQFRMRSPNKESLESDVKSLIREAVGYTRSCQYNNDLEKALEPNVRKEHNFTVKTFHSQAR